MLQVGEWKNLSNIQLCGLMSMASNTDDTEQIRKEFNQLHGFFLQVKKDFFLDDDSFKELSIGMSDDFRIAVAEGSTLVRVGSRIFGGRTYI